MEHKCILCGEVIPDKRGGRCYCQACSAYMRAERERKHNEEVQVLRIKHEIEPKPVPKREVTLKKADMAYCRKCDYHGNFDQQILCEYLYRTGERRGCPAGIGCDKRVIKKGEKSTRTCEMCGGEYEGGKSSRFCPSCRKEIYRQRALQMNLGKKENTSNGG